MSRPRTWVRLTAPAVDDLRGLYRRDPQIVRWCLKKMLLLERDPQAGEPLLGGLVGFRKLVVSDRHWRIIWRVTVDESGGTVVDIAEVWAAGARADAEVYAEMKQRLDSLGDAPETRSLKEVVATLGRLSEQFDIAAEPGADPVPDWVVNALVGSAGLNPEDVRGMTTDAAMSALQAFWSRPPGSTE